MTSRLLLALCAGLPLWTAEPARGLVPVDAAVAATVPWKPSFTTQVRGQDRQFVTLDGRTYIASSSAELVTGVADGQDVALTAKLRRLPGNRLGLYRADGVVLTAAGDALAGRLDGDNLHLAGTLVLDGTARTLRVVAAAPAPSDAQLIQTHLAGIADDDWDRRLGVVSWCRDQARIAGNTDFWTATADNLLGRLIEDLGARAAERKDLAMVTRGIDLALNQLRDPGLAARLGSPAWIREHGGAAAEAIARRLRGLGFALYKDQWQPRPQALEREFDDRFNAMGWKDAEGFYRLGRWADDNGESLQRSRERSWRCYQAGWSADPTHAGIARELGVQPQAAAAAVRTAAGPAANAPATDHLDLESGLRVPAPAGWKRGQGTAAATWTDPASDTALISVRTLPAPVDADAQWNLLYEEAKARAGFVELANENREATGRTLRLLRYSWVEGEQQRLASVMLMILTDGPGAVIEARGLPAEQPTLDTALLACATGASRQTVPAATTP